MADEELAVELETTEEVETEETTEAVDATEATEEAESEGEDEIVVTIGDEPPSSEDQEEGLKGPAPEWVKELRKANREKERRIKELEAKLTTSAPETKPEPLGNKPKLEDFDYDSEKFEQELESWYDRKRQHEAEQAKRQEAEQAQQREWQAKLDAYNSEKSKIKVKDYDDAEGIVQEVLNQTQQGIILHGADNAALLVYALGKNPKKAKELAAINDPVKFAFAVAKLEKELKVTNRKAPPPEKTVAGSAPVSGAVTGSRLDQMKAKAQQTGDWSEYFAAKRKSQSK